MKKFLTFAMLTACVTFASQVHAQGSPSDNFEQRLKRASLPSSVSQTTDKGITISITYSQPALKGRTIGKDIEPMNGKVWRAGANEATVLEVNKDVMIQGQHLPAGKYGLYAVVNNGEWTFIINKTWNVWGAFSYKQTDDVIRIKGNSVKSCLYMERLTYTIDKTGKVSLVWGDEEADFHVQ